MKNYSLIILIILIIKDVAFSQVNNTPCNAQILFCANQSINANPQGPPYGFISTTPNFCGGAAAMLQNNPTLFYKIKITVGGVFTFLIRPGIDSNGDGVVSGSEVVQTDYDWAVWYNTPCNNIANNPKTDPVRISFDAPGPSITGMTTTDNDLCEGQGNNLGASEGILKGINVVPGDELTLAINHFSQTQDPFQLIIGGIDGGGGNAGFNTLPYELADANGNIKDQFCVGEDIYLSGFGGGSNSYQIDLLPANSDTPIDTKQINGSLNGFNITSVFENFFESTGFQLNTVYRVRFFGNMGCDCISAILKFKYTCCGNNLDASFSLSKTNSGKLLGTSPTKGSQHTWSVYGISPTTGNVLSMQPLTTSLDPDLSWQAQEACYLVKHKVKNLCGSECSSQRYCNYSCDEKACDISTPTNVHANPNNPNELVWDVVPGALSYVIEILLCDPNCCGAPSGDASSSQLITIHVPANSFPTLSYIINNQDFPINIDGTFCFSWKVFAECKDGLRSLPSSSQCHIGTIACNLHRPVSTNLTNTKHFNGNINENLAVTLFPNPAREEITIDAITPKDVDIVITIYNTSGEVVKVIENAITINGKANIKLKTETFSKGIYLVKISTSNNEIVTKKLIIE